MYHDDPPPLDSSRLDTDLFCIRCSYNLRTLSLDAVCPECGLPLRQSLVTGGQIIWLQKLRRGLNLLYRIALVFAVFAIIYASMIIGAAQNFFFFWSCLHYLTIPLGIIFTIGIFRVTGATPYWSSPQLRPLASATRVVSLLCLACVCVRAASPTFFYGSSVLQLQIYASGYLLEFGNDCLLATFLFLMLAGLGLDVRVWWILVLVFSGAVFAYSETGTYLSYRIWLQTTSGGGSTGPSQPQWLAGLHVLGTIAYIANNILCVIYYRKCRSGVARLIASNLHSRAGDLQEEPSIATSPALLRPGPSPYNQPDETASV